MLEKVKTQLAGGNGTENEGRATGSVSSADAEHATGDDAPPETNAPTEPSPQTIERDEVFGALKNQRRRDVLRHLAETDTEMRLGELAEEIAARETGKDVSQINSQERKRVYVGLYQCHLPKLADIGVIDYNKPRGTIEQGPTFDYITKYLPPEDAHADEDARTYSIMESLSNVVSAGRTYL